MNSDNESTDTPASEENLTQLLQALPQNQDELYDFVYNHLRAIASNRLTGESNNKLLDTTDLVSEAYLKLAGQHTTWRDRRHFYGVASEAMRRILIDAARARKRAKRGGDAVRQPLTGISLPECEWESELLDLHEALTELQAESPDNAEIVQLRYFSGLSCEECAELLEVSLSTVERRWRFARAWLQTKMSAKP